MTTLHPILPATSSARAFASPTLRSIAPTRQRLPAAAKRFLQLKKQNGIYDGRELALNVGLLPVSAYLVDGLLQPCSVNILVGDSGIGKSALVYQLALAVATGKPFLEHPTRRGKVVLVDYENSVWDSHRILQQQCKHLRVEAPYTLQIWPMNQWAKHGTRAQMGRLGLHENVEEVIDAFAPGLVIFDSLRSFHPAMEKDNTAAVKQIKQLRAIAQSKGTAILLVHHVGKQGRKQGASLENGAPLDWLMRSAGSRALINQTDARLALATRWWSDDTLILRGHLRTQGEVGPYLLSRVWDEADEPLGYQRVEATTHMLRNWKQEETFQKLPPAFSFTEARLLYGKQNNATNVFLQKLVRLGLARKTALGQYQKNKSGPNTELGQEGNITSAA
jgi:hypothetical protein